MSLRGRAAIVGVADAVSPTGELDAHGRALEARVIREALEDAGLTLADVDGVCHAAVVGGAGRVPRHPPPVHRLDQHRRVELRGPRRARRGGDRRRPVRSRDRGLRLDAPQRPAPRAEPRVPATGPGPRTRWSSGSCPTACGCRWAPYALAASRHMAEFGTTSEQLAEIAVSTRAWAALNPRARYQDPITVDDVLASPMQSSPLHLLDCCLVTDGAGAFVMTTRRAGAATCPSRRCTCSGRPPATTTR